MTYIFLQSLSLLLVLLNSLSSVVTAFSSTVRPSASTNAAADEKLEGPKNSPFRPWPEPVVECHGDYRDQIFLEHHIGENLYSKQDELPRLPVPELEETISHFLPTALPLAESDDEIASLKAACDQFPQQSQLLQQRLLERKAEYSNSSWLQELWQKKAYFEYRDPVTVLVSYFLLVPDDDTLKGANKGVHRAAAIINALAKARQQICSGEMMYETIPHNNAEDDVLCSTGFKYLFHSCRIPNPNQDFYKIYDPSLHKHCIVACGGQFFSFDFCDDRGEPLDLPILFSRLQICVELAADSNAKHYPEMGWLTSDNRDTWAKARQELLRVGGKNMEEALSKLESGAFVIDLDDEEPESLTDAATLFWHGGEHCGRNRWFDKAIQLVVSKNGKVAYLGEHSMLDAAPTIPLIRRIMKTTFKRLSKNYPDLDAVSPDIVGVTNVFEECWSSESLLTTAQTLTELAKRHHQQFTGQYEMQAATISTGKKFLKQAGFAGPEFAQMALQLAGYRLFGKQVGTYEAALTRYFLHGRTETARPVSPESNAFVKAMDDDDVSRDQKRELLKRAALVHMDCAEQASQGQGVDRHFFGLSSMLKEGEEAPSLFSHPLFLRSKNWRLTTSSVIFCPGFGPVVDDGIGVGYLVSSDSTLFTCTSRRDNKYIGPFCKLLVNAMEEMADLVKPDD